MVNTSFSVKSRSEMGKAVRKLRRARFVPGQIMGEIKEPTPVVFPEAAFVKLYQEVGDSGLVYVTVEGEKTPRPVMVEEVQSDSLTGRVLHVLFKQVNLKEKISAEIPVELINEKEIPGSLLLTVRDVIEVEALPTDLPEMFEVDVSGLTEIGQSINLKDLHFDAQKVTLLVSEDELESPVVIRQAIKGEVEEENPTPETVVESEGTPEAAAEEAPKTE